MSEQGAMTNWSSTLVSPGTAPAAELQSARIVPKVHMSPKWRRWRALSAFGCTQRRTPGPAAATGSRSTRGHPQGPSRRSF
jgi:hypothetical protein